MQDYMDSTSNVIEGALSTDALTGDKAYYSSLKQRFCKLFILALSIIITTQDVASDWYNYIAFQQQRNIHQNEFQVYTVAFYGGFLGICIAGTVVWIATLTIVVLQFQTVLWAQKKSACLEFVEETISMTLLTFQDLPMLGLLTASITLRFCPLVEQMRTAPGQIALVSTGASLVFKMARSLVFCCSCRAKKQAEPTKTIVKILTACYILLKTVLLALGAVLLLLLVLVSFAPDPNGLPWLKVIMNTVDQGKDFSGPIYLYQKYDLPYTVRRIIESNDVISGVLPPAGDYDQWLERKRRGGKQLDYDCDHYVHRLYLGDSRDLEQLGSISQTFDCSEINPHYATSLPDDIAPLLGNHTCELNFNVTYDEQWTTLALTSLVTLRPITSLNTSTNTNSTTTNARSPCVEVTLDDSSERLLKFTAPLISGWSSKSMTELKDYECKHSYECSSTLPPLFDTHVKPYFSCLEDVCATEFRPTTLRKDGVRDALLTFTYSAYTLVMPQSPSYFPCLLSVTTSSRRLRVGQQCIQSGPPATDNIATAAAENSSSSSNSGNSSAAGIHSSTPIQILSCPESPFTQF